MLIPIGTDAPVYHWPVSTIGLIAINTVVFFFAGPMPEWRLSIGNGCHPMQWVSAAFLHADVYHLIGNMIFLWAYGLVVERKIGWWRFLLTYLVIVATQHLIVQTVFGVAGTGWGVDRVRYALGASGAINGLMAMALLWAPENSLTVVWGDRCGPFASATDHEISILGFSLWHIGWDLFVACLNGFPLGTQVLHLVGAAVGVIVGMVFLQNRWVNCEGFDVFTRWSGRRGQPLRQLQLIWNSVRLRRRRRDRRSKPVKCLQTVISFDEPDVPKRLARTKGSRPSPNRGRRTNL